MHFVHLQHGHDGHDLPLTVETTGRLVLVLAAVALATRVALPVAEPAPQQTFEEAWPAPLPAIAAPAPRMVKTETYRAPDDSMGDLLSAPIAPPGRIEPVRPPPPPVPEAGDPVPKSQGRDTLTEEDRAIPRRVPVRLKKVRAKVSDVCARYHMRKVYSGKYSWRCRKITKD